MSDILPDTAHPRLASGVRLHNDKVRGGWVLLAPEALIEVNGPAFEIIRRCDGSHSVGEILAELKEMFSEGGEEIDSETRAFLSELAAKKLVKL